MHWIRSFAVIVAVLTISCSPSLWQTDLRGQVELALTEVQLLDYRLSVGGEDYDYAWPEHTAVLQIALANPGELDLLITPVVSDPSLFEQLPVVTGQDADSITLEFVPSVAARDQQLELSLELEAKGLSRSYEDISFLLDSRFPGFNLSNFAWQVQAAGSEWDHGIPTLENRLQLQFSNSHDIPLYIQLSIQSSQYLDAGVNQRVEAIDTMSFDFVPSLDAHNAELVLRLEISTRDFEYKHPDIELKIPLRIPDAAVGVEISLENPEFRQLGFSASQTRIPVDELLSFTVAEPLLSDGSDWVWYIDGNPDPSQTPNQTPDDYTFSSSIPGDFSLGVAVTYQGIRYSASLRVTVYYPNQPSASSGGVGFAAVPAGEAQ